MELKGLALFVYFSIILDQALESPLQRDNAVFLLACLLKRSCCGGVLVTGLCRAAHTVSKTCCDSPSKGAILLEQTITHDHYIIIKSLGNIKQRGIWSMEHIVSEHDLRCV